YAAVDAQLGRRVAIKLLHPHLQGDEQGRARLLREARAMARLEHAHVARLYEVGAGGDQVYIAMELIEGVTLEAGCTSARGRGRRCSRSTFRPAARWRRRTARACSTATSSPRTCWSTPATAPASSTSASPAPWTPARRSTTSWRRSPA